MSRTCRHIPESAHIRHREHQPIMIEKASYHGAMQPANFLLEDRQIEEALVAIAGHMQEVIYEGRSAKRAYEAELQSAVCRALRVALPVPVDPEVTVTGEFRGGVDVAIGETPPYAGLIELKWWFDPVNQVDDSLWDLMKMAFYRRGQKTEKAFLISGGSPAAWSGKYPFAKFWDGGTFEPENLWRDRKWAGGVFKPGKNCPLELPAPVITTPLGDGVPPRGLPRGSPRGSRWTLPEAA
jgi:hypothetical protein